ncbi:Crp/Fnr family transcriptional regulator [Echinicola pacifica]|uniref:Crp/Fnr family transcriptional regulator n=1 Tax=Echinicola pacifica TaxID=346377 RepID=A0A918Q079_9BACT|nr:Crp/Fnr family transcriptional regulator [Echinicola pacifica]GGZ27299.1 Crp/Fnr family transcriptional regulator [Echinicola pacifica]
MNKSSIQSVLPGFKDQKLLDAIEEVGQVITMPAGTVLMEPGRTIDRVPLVLEGAIKVLRMDEEGKELFLYYIYPGETCALSLSCCQSRQLSEIRAVLEEDSLLLTVPAEVHEAWNQSFPDWKNFVSQTYQKRFQEMLKVLDSVAFLKMDQRLVRYLVAKKEKNGGTELHLTHQEIANELGTSREVISRLLKQLEKKKWIELGRNKIDVRADLEELDWK